MAGNQVYNTIGNMAEDSDYFILQLLWLLVWKCKIALLLLQTPYLSKWWSP